jgi:hypothetical protein
MRLFHIAATAALLLSQLAMPALANPPGNGFCPPGLAKKSPACIPPGQAKKGVTEWKPGDTVDPNQVSQWITQPSRYSLPPLAPGERYVVVNGQVLKVSDQTYKVIALYKAAVNLFN